MTEVQQSCHKKSRRQNRLWRNVTRNREQFDQFDQENEILNISEQFCVGLVTQKGNARNRFNNLKTEHCLLLQPCTLVNKDSDQRNKTNIKKVSTDSKSIRSGNS